MGFVNRIIDRTELLAKARATAAVLAAKPPEAMRLTRRLLRQHHAILLERMEEERQILAARLQTEETQAIMAGVLKKR
jgi:enoyl-CoA hydratase/carnithine racemase